MFKVDGHKVIIKDMHRIVNNKFILYNDEDNDILYTGTNLYGNRILGAIMFDDDENDFLRYIHVILTDEQYHSFVSKKISLRKILVENESLFLIDKGYDNTELRVNLVSFDEIPEEFKPLENSFCPSFIVEPSFTYCVSLKGADSDLHRASPVVLNDVNTKFSRFLESSTEFIKELDFNRSVYIEANQIGSFEILFNIDLSQNQQLSIYDISQEKINVFLNGLYQYIFYTLPNEKEDVFKGDKVESDDFKHLENKLTEIYESAKLKPEAGLEQKVIDLINYSVSNIKEIDYNTGFNRIEFANISSKGEVVPIGFLNNKFIPSVQNKLFELETKLKEDIIIFDKNPKKYKIQVYQFNIQSGNGGAFVMIEDEKLVRTCLKVHGNPPFEHTVFTRSMDEGKLVEVEGIAKRINDKISEISVEIK